MNMRIFPLIIFFLTGLSLSAQTDSMQIAPGAQERIGDLLNQPAMIQPAGVTHLGRNWFRLETDSHVITDEANFEQVASAMLDIEHSAEIVDGKKTKLSAHIINQNDDEMIADLVTVSILPVGISIKTPYRVAIKTMERTALKAAMEIRQLDSDNAANKKIKDVYSLRYAEEISIDGKPYTYLRIYTVSNADASILPGARGILERNSGLVAIELLQLIIDAAKKR